MMAQSMGVSVEYVMKPFPELLPALESGDVDIVMSGMESGLIDLLQVQWLERGNWISELP